MVMDEGILNRFVEALLIEQGDIFSYHCFQILFNPYGVD
jgi:hypothetical protein